MEELLVAGVPVGVQALHTLQLVQTVQLRNGGLQQGGAVAPLGWLAADEPLALLLHLLQADQV